MSEQTVMASVFKERCLAFLQQVSITGEPITVTKRGKPVARLVPIKAAAPQDMRGSVRLIAKEDAAYYSTGERWEADDA